MDLFPGVLLLVSHDPQYGRQDHPRTMNPLQVPMEAYGAFGFDPGNLRGKNGIVSSCPIESRGQAAQRDMEIQIGCGGLGDYLSVFSFGLGLWPGNYACDHRNRGDQAERLMDLEHVCS